MHKPSIKGIFALYLCKKQKKHAVSAALTAWAGSTTILTAIYWRLQPIGAALGGFFSPKTPQKSSDGANPNAQVERKWKMTQIGISMEKSDFDFFCFETLEKKKKN